MKGLIAFNVYGSALALTVASAIFAFDVANGREVSDAAMMAYAVGVVLLLVSGGLYLYRKFYMRRYYTAIKAPLISNNMIRRQRRNRRPSREAFLDPVGVNLGIRKSRPELASQVEACLHPDYQQASPNHPYNWNCVSCSLTVTGHRKPDPGPREIV